MPQNFWRFVICPPAPVCELVHAGSHARPHVHASLWGMPSKVFLGVYAIIEFSILVDIIKFYLGVL